MIFRYFLRITLLFCIFVCVSCSQKDANPLAGAPVYSIEGSVLQDVVKEYCVDCHNPEETEGNLDLASVVDGNLNDNPYIWLDVAWVLDKQEMPPTDDENTPIPDADTYAEVNQWLGARLGDQEQSQALLASSEPHNTLVNQFCLSCHNDTDKKGGITLTALGEMSVHDQAELWEKALKKLRARQMPPPNRKRPSEEAYAHVISEVERELDQLSEDEPQYAQADAFRRLTRTEYQNAIRDLLDLEIDATRLLPSDQESHGFDNVSVSDLSPTRIERYLSAAQKISRLALGNTGSQPGGSTYRNSPDHSQEQQIHGLPLGTQGGMLVDHFFPVGGRYRIQARLSRDRDEYVEGLLEEHKIHFLVDGALQHSIDLVPPKDRDQYAFDDSELYTDIQVDAGDRKVGVTFPRNNHDLLETYQQPLNVAFNRHRHPRKTPAIYEVSITGPFEVTDTDDVTESKKKLLDCYPVDVSDHEACAEVILSRLAKVAYRRPVSEIELKSIMSFYFKGEQEKGFETGIEKALSAILVNPSFLFRIANSTNELDEIPSADGLALASRLAFFIWNSLPDEELLQLAINNSLGDEQVLSDQVSRMLAHPKAQGMISNFTEQWLHLRNLSSITPDSRAFPDFDNNLRQSMRNETVTFVSDILSSDQSIVRLLDANYSYLDERLAKHYDIPHVFGPRMRKVEFNGSEKRSGLLRHASVLTLTSYATRTSPVVRGNWILENIMGTPPPPPPPDIPDLPDDIISESLSVRERLAKHRADPTCASCHNLIDPMGFALENYDAVGRWRALEHGKPVDATAMLPDGQDIMNSDGLIQNLVARPEPFIYTFTEKLMTFALGRGLEYTDASAIREIVRQAEKQDYQFAAIVIELVKSPAFLSQDANTNTTSIHSVERQHVSK